MCMKRHFFVVTVSLLLLFSCEETNLFLITEAGIDAVNAVTLSDEDVRRIASQAAMSADSKHRVAGADSSYERRLRKLMAGYGERDGQSFDVKVYLTREVNAFAMADGTIRVCSGLMDIMNDRELLFVIGHEMGHVVKKHSRKKVVLAYASSAVRKGLASQENEIGQIARSAIGSFAEQLANAQFSQHEEREADDYGALFLEKEGYSTDAAVSALRKLSKLAGQHTFLSSHPDPATRAERLENGGRAEDGDGETPMWDTFMLLLKKIITFVMRLVQYVISLIL